MCPNRNRANQPVSEVPLFVAFVVVVVVVVVVAASTSNAGFRWQKLSSPSTYSSATRAEDNLKR
jgi:hypothetical protein